MGKSKIEWTDKVLNLVTGCTKISPGCKNCYAERMTRRLKAMDVKKKLPVGKEHKLNHMDIVEIMAKN